MHNIVEGYQLEVPGVFVRWGISKNELHQLLDKDGLEWSTKSERYIRCVSLGGLETGLLFSFSGMSKALLTGIYLSETIKKDAQRSDWHDRVKHYLVQYFGSPHEEKIHPISLFPLCMWTFSDVEIRFTVHGTEPQSWAGHMSIEKIVRRTSVPRPRLT